MAKDTNAAIVVIGGGAAGLAAAITAGRMLTGQPLKILILDRMDRIGKKILATGNGRCNLANTKFKTDYYHGDVSFASRVFEKMNLESTLSFFTSLGLLMVPDSEGRIYPFSGQAASVLDVLRFEIERLGIEVRCPCEAVAVEKTNDGFKIRTTSGPVYAGKVIMAAGGLAAPELGSNGSGFELLKKLSHTVIQPFPALVQLKTHSEYPRQLKGIRFNGELSLKIEEETKARQRGEIMFTEYGISGIPTMQLSRIASQYFHSGGHGNVCVSIDFMTGYDKSDIYRVLTERIRRLPEVPLENFFAGIFNKRIGQIICKSAGLVPLSRKAGTLSQGDAERLVNVIKAFPLPVIGTRGFSSAQVTAGGGDTYQFREETMESLVVPGMYAAGEMLNVDGDCGGYNLMWAWSSGRLAGESAAKSLLGIASEPAPDFSENEVLL